MWMRLRRHSLFHICGESLSSVLAYYDDVPEVDLMKMKEGAKRWRFRKLSLRKIAHQGLNLVQVEFSCCFLLCMFSNFERILNMLGLVGQF